MKKWSFTERFLCLKIVIFQLNRWLTGPPLLKFKKIVKFFINFFFLFFFLENFISKRFRRKVAPFKENEKSVNKKLEEPFEADGKHPLLYVERSCEVFGRRIATAVFNVCSSADIYKIHTDSLRDALEPEVKHLLSLITSYREDLRYI